MFGLHLVLIYLGVFFAITIVLTWMNRNTLVKLENEINQLKSHFLKNIDSKDFIKRFDDIDFNEISKKQKRDKIINYLLSLYLKLGILVIGSFIFANALFGILWMF